MKDIDIEKLREYLIHFFGAAITVFPVAQMDVFEVINASEEELIKIAEDHNIDLQRFQK